MSQEHKILFWLDDDPKDARINSGASSQKHRENNPRQAYSPKPSQYSSRGLSANGFKIESRFTPRPPLSSSSNPTYIQSAHAKVRRIPTIVQILKFIKVRYLKLKLQYKKRVYNKRRQRLATALLIIVVALFGAGLSYWASEIRKSRSEASVEAQVSGLDPLLPKDKINNQDQLNAIFDSKRQVYSYPDTYNGVKFTVSQQPLPETFKTDKNAIKTLASTVNANHELTSNKGTVYIATDEEQGLQVAVLQTDDHLLFVRSDNKLEDFFWVRYINNLKASG